MTVRFTIMHDTTVGVHIQTPDLSIRDIQEDDQETFSDMQPYILEEQAHRQVFVLARRWFEGNLCSGFTVFQKNSKAPIGFIILNPSGSPGEATMASVGQLTEYQNQIDTAIHAFAVGAFYQGYRLNGAAMSWIRDKDVKRCILNLPLGYTP